MNKDTYFLVLLFFFISLVAKGNNLSNIILNYKSMYKEDVLTLGLCRMEGMKRSDAIAINSRCLFFLKFIFD